MIHVTYGVFFLLFFQTAVLLTLTRSSHGQLEVIGPNQPVLATVGDDIILPCYLYPTMDASDMTVEWSRPDLGLRIIHVWPERPELQNPSYKDRASLFINELKHGEISLKISKVKPFDEGKYRCFVPDLRKDSTVWLIVGAASSPVISLAGLDKSISGVVLQCESAGWYPEPELLWLDGEGNLLSAGPTETLRGPDDLYTVSSRVTVEKRHSNNITCRVQQRNTNQSRETHIHVPDDFFMVIPSGPPNHPISDPNVTVALAVTVSVVLLLIAAVFFVLMWRGGKFKKKKKSEEDTLEQGRKEKTIKSKNDSSGLQMVEGESEPLMTGREEDDDDVDRREEQRHEDERETKEDQFVSETEQIKDINSPQEKRINPSTVNDKESLITIEQETHEEQEVTGREEDDLDNNGEQKSKKRHNKMIMKKQKNKKKQNKEVDTDNPGTKTSALTETEPQFEMKQETHEEQSRRGRHETHNVDIRGEQRNKDEIKMSRTAEDKINQFIMTEKGYQSTAEKETHEEEMTERRIKAQGAEGEKEKIMETEKDCIEFHFLLGKNLKKSIVLVKKGKSFQLSSFNSLIADIKSLNSHVSSDQEPWREKKTQQEQLVEKRQMERNVDMRNSTTEKERAEENSDEVNDLYSVFMAERKREEQSGQTESMVSSVNSKVPLNTDLKIQDKTRGQNHEKQPEETSQQSREEIREQPEKLRGAKRKEGAQGEELEESVSLTGRGVSSVEKKEEEELLEEASDVDQNNIQSRKHTQEIKLQDVCTLQDKKEEIHAGYHQNFKKVQKYVNKQNDQFMEVDDFAHNQNAATAQLYENIQWAKHQQRLPVQTDQQDFLKEYDEDVGDQMEVEEHSHHKEPKEEPMLLLEEKSSNFPLPLYTDQEPWRKKETQGQLVEKTQRVESEVLEVNQGLKSEEANRKDKETEKLQLPREGELQAEQQVNVNQKEQLEESVSLTGRGVICVEGKQEEELMQQTSDVDQNNYKKRKLDEECKPPVKKQKILGRRFMRHLKNHKGRRSSS